MEIEKKNKKRVTKEDEEDYDEKLNQKSKLKGSKKEKEENGSEVTEEEVEEFYAILKRMKVVVKYFDDKGKGGREWRETLEKSPEIAAVHGGDVVTAGEVEEKIGGEEVLTINKGFDLNDVASEAAESGGA